MSFLAGLARLVGHAHKSIVSERQLPIEELPPASRGYMMGTAAKGAIVGLSEGRTKKINSKSLIFHRDAVY
jgi:hypothetical protein